MSDLDRRKILKEESDIRIAHCQYPLKCYRIAGCTLAIFNIILLSWAIGVTARWYKVHNDHIMSGESHEELYCRPQTGTGECEDTINVEGRKFCCTNDTLAQKLDRYSNISYAEHLVSTRRQQNFMHPCQSKNYTMPAARVVGPEKGFTSTNLDWDRKSNHSFQIGNSLTYIHGRFIISKPGFYYVYSQVTFQENMVSERQDKPLIHTVLRQRGDKKDMILQDILPACKLQALESNSASFVGAALHLLEKDEIMVTVSDHIRVFKSPLSNFFGLHMI